VATLKDILTYLHFLSIFKGERPLPRIRPSVFVRRLVRRRRGPIPYPKGRLGGYLVPFWVVEPKRLEEHLITIEMFPPTALRPYWLPVELELTLLQIAAISKISPTRLYRLCKTFLSLRKRGSKLVFDRDAFIEHDLEALNPDYFAFGPDGSSEPPTTPPTPAQSFRPGRHIPGCDRQHLGKCETRPETPVRVPKRTSDTPRREPRWTEKMRRTNLQEDVPAEASWDTAPSAPIALSGPPARATSTELRLWRLAGKDPRRYSDLAVEYSDEISADRAAGRFESQSMQKGARA
jgi:hypothetical protein